jgi:hypothetical protein
MTPKISMPQHRLGKVTADRRYLASLRRNPLITDKLPAASSGLSVSYDTLRRNIKKTRPYRNSLSDNLDAVMPVLRDERGDPGEIVVIEDHVLS